MSIYLYAALAAVLLLVGGIAGYKVGTAVQSRTDNVALSAALKQSTKAVADAKAQLDAQAAQYATEKAAAAKSRALADQLFNDMRDDVSKSTLALRAAKVTIQGLRSHDANVTTLLDTPLPASLVDGLRSGSVPRVPEAHH